MNGAISPQNADNNLAQSDETTFNSHISNINPSIPNNSTHPNWDLVNNPITSSGLLTSAIPIPHNGRTPVVCAPPYLFHQTAPPFFAPAGPHNPLYVPTIPPPGPMSSLAAHTVNPKDKSLRMPSNANIISTSTSQKFSPKISGASNCDNRNFYMQQNYHYPEVC